MNFDDIVEYWRRLQDKPPYIHPDDAPFEQYLNDCETDLFPQPWVGDIKSARVYVMQLNPGFGGSEESIERQNADFANAIRQNLTGCSENAFLQDAFRIHPGRQWTEKIFGPTADLTQIRQHVALIELGSGPIKTIPLGGGM